MRPRCRGRPRGGAGGTAGAAAASWLGADPGLDRSPASILPSGSRSCSQAPCQSRASRGRRTAAAAPLPAATRSDRRGWGTGWCPGGTMGTPPFLRWTEVSGELGVGRRVFSVHPSNSSLLEVEKCPTAYACAQDYKLYFPGGESWRSSGVLCWPPVTLCCLLCAVKECKMYGAAKERA